MKLHTKKNKKKKQKKTKKKTKQNNKTKLSLNSSVDKSYAYLGRSLRKRVICGPRRSRSACVSAQSDQDLRCQLNESLDTTECISREQMPGCDYANAWDDSESVCILRMLEGCFFD